MRSFLPQITPYLHLGWRWPDGLRSLRHRNFRLFFFSQLISLTGTWMQATAQQWLVFRITGSQISLGVVTFAGFVPVLVLSLFMGVLVDRLPRRRLLLWTQFWFLLCAAALALLTFAGIVEYWHIVVLALLFGIGNALDMPARQAFHLDLVARGDLINAIALNSSVFNGARILGPFLGGLIVATLGEAPAFGLNAISYLAVLGGLLLMHLPRIERGEGATGGWQELKEGLRYLVRDHALLGLVAMIGLFSVVGFPYLVLLPAYAQNVLGLGAQGFGILMAATGVGALASGIELAFSGHRRHKGRLLSFSRVLLAVSLLVVGLSRSLPLAMLGLAGAGYAFISQLAATNTLIQLLVPDRLRGRIMSAYTWALGGFWPIGSLLIGFAGERFGTSEAILLSAAGSLLLTLIGVVVFPETRRLA
ncbi:MAG: MFS transporter [Anaerolineales bacterium]